MHTPMTMAVLSSTRAIPLLNRPYFSYLYRCHLEIFHSMQTPNLHSQILLHSCPAYRGVSVKTPFSAPFTCLPTRCRASTDPFQIRGSQQSFIVQGSGRHKPRITRSSWQHCGKVLELTDELNHRIIVDFC